MKDWAEYRKFKLFGVKIGIRFNDVRAIPKIENILPFGHQPIEGEEVDFLFSLVWRNEKDGGDLLFVNDERVVAPKNQDRLIKALYSQIRLRIGEFTKECIFVHAGSVVWNGKSIILPADSFGGKTTLTAEFVKAGALYLSDEYAVLDKNGILHPFPKPLSIRHKIAGEIRQIDTPVEHFGGKQSYEPTKADIVLFTEYQKFARWKPVSLTFGAGILASVKHTVSARKSPELVFDVLSESLKNAVFLKGNRGDSKTFVENIASFFQ